MEISGFSNISNLDLGMEDHSAEDWINDMECSSTHWNPMMSFQGAPPYSTSSWTSYQTSFFQFGNSSTCDSHASSPIHVGFVGSTKTSSAVDRRHSEKKLGGHSLAERKRREKLNQLFIALSALLPGLKKMDKASILDDAIAYMKELRKQVKGLEENAKKKSTSNLKSTVSFTIKKDGGGGGEKSSDSSSCSSVMAARFNEKELLISIHCDTRKGLLQEIVGEIEKLHLSVVNSSVMSCGDSSLTISLIAEKNEEAKMSMEQLVKNLRGLLKMILSK